MDRPHVVAAWLQQLLVQRKRDGGLAVPSPVLTRAYQLVAEAMAGYEQCRKIADTPFPFAWAQVGVGGGGVGSGVEASVAVMAGGGV
jgi:hypothetical protein